MELFIALHSDTASVHPAGAFAIMFSTARCTADSIKMVLSYS
ncbi:hypothetical protein [Nocardia sp. NBC_00403]